MLVPGSVLDWSVTDRWDHSPLSDISPREMDSTTLEYPLTGLLINRLAAWIESDAAGNH